MPASKAYLRASVLQKTLTWVTGLFVLALGGGILAAWQSDCIPLIQIHPLFAAMHYNAALGLAVLGLGLIAHALRWRAGSAGCGLAVAGGGIVVLLATLAHWDLGLVDWWFAIPQNVSFPFSGGMAPTLGLCFVLAGSALVLLPWSGSYSWGTFVLALLGATVVILAVAAYLGYALGPTGTQHVRPAIQAIIGLFLVGATVLVAAFTQETAKASRAQWLPLLVGLSCITITLILWQAMAIKENLRFDEMIQFETVHLQRRLQEEIPARIQPLVIFANKLAASAPGERPKTWVDTGALSFHSPGCMGVGRLKGDRQVDWLITVPSTRKTARNPAEHWQQLPPLLEEARTRGETRIFLAPRSWWGVRALVFYVPLPPGRDADGGLFAIFRLRELLDNVLPDSVSPGYALILGDDEEEIYTRFATDTIHQSGREKAQRVTVMGRTWHLRVWPTQDILSRQGFSLARLALLVGLLATVLLALAVQLALTARVRARALEKEISERTQAEGALRLSEAKYRSLFESLDQGVFLKDSQGRYVAVNQPFCRNIGVSEAELLNNTDADVLPKHLAEQYQAEELLVLIQGKKIERETEIRGEGRGRFVRRILTPVRDQQGQVSGVLGICWDVTEQRTLEGHLRQSQKMEAIGQLAGGIAHDFNNLLTVILGNLDLMALRMSLSEEANQIIQAAQKAGRRAAALTHQLLGFSRQRQLLWQPTDLNSVIDEVVVLLARTIDPRIQIVAKKSENPWLVHGDPSQLNQVLMNLCLNARDAISGHGQITIETAWLELDKTAAARHFEARPGEFVRLRISDTGQGMTPEVRARLFEPFFTTKEVGKGTGLGLAMVFGIVKQHQGWIECYSEVNHGTRFDIYLPRAASDVKDRSGLMPRPQITKEGNEMLLIVDDEPLIRKLVVTVLKSHGYGTLEAADGLEAVEVFRANRDKIDLVLLDLTMPRLSGQETFRQLLQIDADVAVVFASGYSAENVTPEEMQLIYGFAKKPFLTGELLQTLQNALDQVRRGKPQGAPMACAV